MQSNTPTTREGEEESLSRNEVPRRRFLRGTGAAVAGGAIALSGCTGGAVVGGETTELSFVIAPFDEPSLLRKAHQPIMDYLEGEVSGLEMTMNVATDYSAILPALKSGQAHLSNDDTPLLAAPDSIGVVGIALNEGAKGYYSVIASLADSDITELADLQGKTMAFADRLSGSGSLFPLYGLMQAGLDIGDAPQGDPVDFEGQWSSHNQARQTLFNRDEVVMAANYAGGLVPHAQSSDVEDGGPFNRICNGTSHCSEAESKDPTVQIVWASDMIPESPIITSPVWEDKRDEVSKAILEMNEERLQPYVDDLDDVAMSDVQFIEVAPGSVDDYQPVLDVFNALDIDIEG